jgi:hypothetical protein
MEEITSIITLLEQRKTAIDRALTALREVDGLDTGWTFYTPFSTSYSMPEPEVTTGRKGKKRSAAVRKRMKEAQQLRWARIRGESEPMSPATTEAPKPKRTISAEGIKRIIAATKKRWALKRAEAEASLEKAGRKKAAA